MTAGNTQDSGQQDWRAAFLARENLPADYLTEAGRWFDPVAVQLVKAHRSSAQPTLLVGINGAQGAGKTTLVAYLCDWLVHEAGLSALCMSLDDFYLTRAERQALADAVHPLLATRGVPGTHDIPLLLHTLQALTVSGDVAVPRFSKAEDDRQPAAAWPRIRAPLDVVLLEGWCLGATPEPPAALAVPCNALERREDPQAVWRGHVNQQLAGDYATLHAQPDCWLMLKAPSFDDVLRWRTEQENRLRARIGASEHAIGLMDEAALAHFVQHYERLTRHCLASLPPRMDLVWTLGSDRSINAWAGPMVPR